MMFMDFVGQDKLENVVLTWSVCEYFQCGFEGASEANSHIFSFVKSLRQTKKLDVLLRLIIKHK